MDYLNNRKPLRIVVLATALATGGVFAVSAQTTPADQQQEAQQFLSAPKSLSDAVVAAEASTGGKAMSATYETANGATSYVVELVAADGTESAVSVDATSGAVIAMAADTEDGQAGDQENGSGSDGESQDDNG